MSAVLQVGYVRAPYWGQGQMERRIMRGLGFLLRAEVVVMWGVLLAWRVQTVLWPPLEVIILAPVSVSS